MANFDQKVTIEIDVKTDKLDQISESLNELKEAQDSLDSLEGNLDDLEDNFRKFSDAVDESRDKWDKFSEDDDPLSEFRGSISETENEVGFLRDALEEEVTVNANIDKESFKENVKENLEEKLREEEVTADVAIGEEVDTPSRSKFIGNINEFIDDVEDDIKPITPVLDDNIESARGRVNTAEIARKVGNRLQGVEESDQVELTPRIAGEVKWSAESAGGSKAMASYNARIEALQNRPGMKKLEPEMKGTVNFEGFDEDAFDLPDNMGEDLETARKTVSEINKLNEKKEELEETQDNLGDTTEDTVVSTDSEARAFNQLIDEGSDLADVKQAAADSNSLLNEANKESIVSTLNEADAQNKLAANGIETKEALDDLLGLQEDLADTSEDTADSLSLEDSITKQLEGDLDGLSAAKKAASDANSKLGDDTNRTKGELADEFDISEEAAESIFDLGESHRSAARGSRKLRSSLDETTDSMRAANKVGGLFEDGLGSLSVNLGAFTVALRNFLTQVPLLLAALGSLGSAAIGVAGAFITAGGAIGSAIGAGALAMAQDLDEQYQEIEGTGEALQVMMLGLKDTFLDAISPLTENAEVVRMFRQFVVGLAEDISLLADTFDVLLTRQSDWKEGVLGISGVMDELGERLAEPFKELVQALSFMFLNLQDEFIEITVGLVDALTGLTRFTTRFANGITEDTRVLDQFVSSLNEMAKIGATIFSGLEPILISFSSAMERVAGVINSMNTEFVASAITFGIIIGAINRFGGVIASVVGLIPNLIFGIKSADGSMMSMVKSMGAFIKQNNAMFGGLTSLAEAFEDLGDEMTLFRLRAKKTEDSFDELGEAQAEQLRHTLMNTESMDEFSEELINAAVAAELTDDELEELNDELKRVGFGARFAESGLDDLQDSDMSNTDLDVKRSLALDTAVEGSDEAILSLSTFSDKLKNLKKFIPIVGGAGLTGAVKGLAGALSGAAGVLGGSFLPALAIIISVGAVLVGLIGNLDSIMSALRSTASTLGDVLSWIGGQMMQVFIDAWNMLLDIMIGIFMVIKPLIDFFNALAGGSEETSGILDALAGTIEFLVDAFGAMFTVIGSLARVIGIIIGGFFELFSAMMLSVIGIIQGGLVKAITFATNVLLDLFGVESDANSFFSSMISLIGDLIKWIDKIPELTELVMRDFVKIMQDAFNRLIEGFNDFVETMNTIKGVDFEKAEKVDFAVYGDAGARVSKSEVASQTDELMEGLVGSRDKSVTYNEDSSTNIDQTVNADPEDKPQLSRVTKDAIEEANAFARRRQGGQ